MVGDGRHAHYRQQTAGTPGSSGFGTVNLNQYATGSALAAAGVISGYDMTAEAALTKLAYLLSRDLPLAEIKRLMQEDLRGELTQG